jgi:hypothetical protein
MKTTLAGLAREIAIKSVEDTRNSLAYCASGLRELLIGGFVIIACVILVGFPFFLGYLHACLTRVMAGDETLPRFGKSPGLLKDGLRVIAIGLVYVVVIVLPFLVLLALEIFTLPGLTITKLNGPGEAFAFTVSYSGFTATTVIITITSLALTFVFTTLFSNAWLQYTLDGQLRQAMNPVRTIKWTLANPDLILSKMFSFGLLGLLFAVPGLLVALLPGVDRDWWLPFRLYTIAYLWLVFMGLTANTFLRGRQIRSLLKEGKIRSVD